MALRSEEGNGDAVRASSLLQQEWRHASSLAWTAFLVFKDSYRALVNDVSAQTPQELDLWGSGAEGAERRDGGDPGPSGSGGEDFEDRARRVLRQEVVVRRRKALRVAPIPAVEVAVPGSSYNPTYEDHQDAVAAAVAQEMKKELRKELGPKVEKARMGQRARGGFPAGCSSVRVACEGGLPGPVWYHRSGQISSR